MVVNDDAPVILATHFIAQSILYLQHTVQIFFKLPNLKKKYILLTIFYSTNHNIVTYRSNNKLFLKLLNFNNNTFKNMLKVLYYMK